MDREHVTRVNFQEKEKGIENILHVLILRRRGKG